MPCVFFLVLEGKLAHHLKTRNIQEITCLSKRKLRYFINRTLSQDPAEKYNLARLRDVVEKIEELMEKAHTPHPNWTVPEN